MDIKMKDFAQGTFAGLQVPCYPRNGPYLARVAKWSALHRSFPIRVFLGAFVSVWAGENSDVHAALVVITLNAPVTSIKLIFKAAPSHTSAPRRAPTLDCCIFCHCQSPVNTGHYRSPVGPFTGSQSKACTRALANLSHRFTSMREV